MIIINKEYLGDITYSNEHKSFTHKMAAKPACLDMERNYFTAALCINVYFLFALPA